MNSIAASFGWLPVVRWGCIFVGIPAGYSRPPVVRWGRNMHGISAIDTWPPFEWLGRVIANRHCCMALVTLPIGAATGWHFCAPVVAPK
jgi:hypothetical protein